jgi:hypothetical protein
MSRLRALVYYNGRIQQRNQEGVVFISENTIFLYIERGWSLLQLRSLIHEKLHLGANERVSRIWYRMPISSGSVL